MPKFERFFRADQANIGVIFAIAVIPIIGAIGTAVDLAKTNDVSVQLQKAVDAAVLAGVTQPANSQISTASEIFSGDYGNKYSTAASVSFVQNADGSLSGQASTTVPASFLTVFGISSIPARAVATAKRQMQSQIVCILLLNKAYSQSLLINGGAILNAPNCEIDVLTTQNPAAVFNATLNVKNICVAGSTVLKNGGANPPVQTGCAAITDPFAGKLPQVANSGCDFSSQTYNSGNVTLNPGVYCGGTNFNGSGSATLNPGLYVISGGSMSFNSNWTFSGSGVTFYLVDQNASIVFNGAVNANLSAPTSGTYANILMFEPTGLSGSPFVIDGTSNDIFSGLIYLPSRNVTINSVSNLTASNVTMVFSTLAMDAINWSITPGALSMSRVTDAATAAYLSQ
jgi:hypothetical protein